MTFCFFVLFCFVLFVCRDQPVHLYDAYTGAIRTTYCPYNSLDEMESPSVVSFGRNGQTILMGGFRTDRMLHVFDVNRPGRESMSVWRLGKTRRSKDGQKGLVSALASCTWPNNLIAVGTYAPGSIYLYDDRVPSTEVASMVITGTCVVGHGKAHARKSKHFLSRDTDGDDLTFSAAKVRWFQSRSRGGVTSLKWDEEHFHYLYSVSRRSNAVLAWDVRRLSSMSHVCPGVASYETSNETNQRLDFAIHESRLWVGGMDAKIRVYQLSSRELIGQMDDSLKDTVNGVSLSNSNGKTLLAVSLGSRKFPSDDDWDNDLPAISALMGTDDSGLQLYDVQWRLPNSG